MNRVFNNYEAVNKTNFGSAKNIGKKEKYLKKYLYIIKKIPNFHNGTMKSKLLLNSKSVRINKICTDFISNLLKN